MQCTRASAQVIRPFPLSSHRAKAQVDPISWIGSKWNQPRVLLLLSMIPTSGLLEISWPGPPEDYPKQRVPFLEEDICQRS